MHIGIRKWDLKLAEFSIYVLQYFALFFNLLSFICIGKSKCRVARSRLNSCCNNDSKEQQEDFILRWCHSTVYWHYAMCGDSTELRCDVSQMCADIIRLCADIIQFRGGIINWGRHTVCGNRTRWCGDITGVYDDFIHFVGQNLWYTSVHSAIETKDNSVNISDEIEKILKSLVQGELPEIPDQILPSSGKKGSSKNRPQTPTKDREDSTVSWVDYFISITSRVKIISCADCCCIHLVKCHDLENVKVIRVVPIWILEIYPSCSTVRS